MYKRNSLSYGNIPRITTGRKTAILNALARRVQPLASDKQDHGIHATFLADVQDAKEVRVRLVRR